MSSRAAQRKALLQRRARRTPWGPSGSQRIEPFDGPYRTAGWTANSVGFSGIEFWRYFDQLPRRWRDRINYALNPTHLVAEYRAAVNETADHRAATSG